MNIKYKALEWQEGQVNLPGIKEIVYGIAKRDILVWPTLPDEFIDNMGELVTYVGDFVLAAGAKFQKIGVIVAKSPLDGKSQGTYPSKTFLNTLVMQHPGVEEIASGYCRQANNDDMVYLAQTKKKKWRVVGNEMWQSDTTIDQKLGGAATDEMGTTLTATITDIAPGLFYVGEIVTEDGIINENLDKVASVTFTPDGGTVGVGVDTIALASATVDATIQYSVDGGAWTIYAAPIPTTGWAVGDHVISARASKVGLMTSNYTAGTFHV